MFKVIIYIEYGSYFFRSQGLSQFPVCQESFFEGTFPIPDLHSPFLDYSIGLFPADAFLGEC